MFDKITGIITESNGIKINKRIRLMKELFCVFQQRRLGF